MAMKLKEGSLDYPLNELRQHLYRAADMIVDLYDTMESDKVLQSRSPSEVRPIFDEPLPESPTDLTTLLKRIEREVFFHANRNIGPNFYGYVQSGGNHAGLVGDLLAMALNQNPGKWHLGPAATEIELRVIRWVAEFIGFPEETGGVLVSGGSAANLTCLKAARDFQAPFALQMQGAKAGSQLTMYVSTEGHSCLDKSADMLGIGREYLRKIPVGSDFRIDVEKLEQKILEDKANGFLPVCIIGNGGTVNTGTVDPLNDLAALAKRHHLWFHIDGAYGGPAAATSLAGAMFSGLEKADSVATDGHKWLYVPYEVGVALVRNKKALNASFRIIPDYLKSDPSLSDRHNATEYHFELSRNFKALKMWMTFLAYGAPALRAAIESNIQTMWFLAKLIDTSEDFERMAPVPLSIVCFRYKTTDPQFSNDEEYLNRLNQKILTDVEKDGRVFLSGTILNGKQVLRACSVNHRTDLPHVQFLLNVLREIVANAHATLTPALSLPGEGRGGF